MSAGIFALEIQARFDAALANIAYAYGNELARIEWKEIQERAIHQFCEKEKWIQVDSSTPLRARYHGDQLEPHRLPQWTSTGPLTYTDVYRHKPTKPG